MQNKVARFLFILLAFLLLLQLFGKPAPQGNPNDEVALTTKSKVTIGSEVIATLENRSAETIKVPNECPKNPLGVEFYQNGEWLPKEFSLQDPSACADQKEISISPKGKAKISFGKWGPGLFGELGKYRLTYKTQLAGKEKTYSVELEVSPPGVMAKLWRGALYQPILNTLFFFVAFIPGHRVGWAILLLTVLIKLILLIPNQKALKSQKALQKIQPQLDALKQLHKDNPQKLAEETMKIWKDHKVNPMGSCLPMLIQFPVLIALFYVVKSGLVVDSSLLYAPLRNFDPAMANPWFLGLDLTKVSTWILPIGIGVLQYLQIRLSFTNAKPDPKSQAAMMNQMMKYVLPVMIGVFAASLPAAVGFYWGVSTLFAIGQQVVVNRAKD